MAISLTRLSGGNTPADGSDPRTFPAIWNASATAIENALAEGGGASVTVSETAPVSPTEGDLWLNSTEAKMYVYYDDGTSAQWVAAVGGTVPEQGKILQVVSTTKTDTWSASVATVTVSGDITGLTASITPSNISNKVLVTFSLALAASNVLAGHVFLYRDGSPIGVGDSAGSRSSATSAVYMSPNGETGVQVSGIFLDSPSTTSSTTYSLRLGHASSVTRTLYLNRSQTDADGAEYGRYVSTINVMEVAG